MVKQQELGLWKQASTIPTRPVDLIPKDVVICDWHYNRADKTPVYFAAKGLNVIACSWNKPEVAVQ